MKDIQIDKAFDALDLTTVTILPKDPIIAFGEIRMIGTITSYPKRISIKMMG